MKKKIVLLPLDERPCNYDFPYEIFTHEDIEIVRPKELGNKKKPADADTIIKFLIDECQNADGLILSLDMMLYGGLVPSRIHQGSVSLFEQLASTIKQLKEENPKLIIYAFQVIMRCPDYSSDDEEPDYYEEYGSLIHRVGEIIHRSRLGLCSDNELKHLLDEIDCDYLNDYVSRRQKNQSLNNLMVDYVKDKYIDALVIPQDDSATYGYASMDQEQVRKKISKENLTDAILMYPGADEVGMTLMSRLLNMIHGKKPRVYVKYACDASKDLIPLYEGSRLAGTIKNHVLSSGCQLTDSYENADIIMAVTAPAEHMEEAEEQPSEKPDYYAERSLPELIDFIKERLGEGKLITIADNAYANGGDLELLRMLDKNNLLTKVAGYAGWNTSANTIGTAIAEGIDAFYYGITDAHQDFLMKRYIEDCGYCSVVRKAVTVQLDGMGMNCYDVKEEKGEVADIVKKHLEQFTKDYMSSLKGQLEIESVYMPWKRMFEIGLKVSCRPLE